MYKTCYTEGSSRRQRELEAALLEAMASQPYKAITLTALCRENSVPRKTFYRYFPTKDDCLLALIDHTLSDCNTISLALWSGGRDLTWEHLHSFFSYWQENRAFLDRIQENDLCPLLLARTEHIVDNMPKAVSCTFAQDQVSYFIAHGLMTAVLRWHRWGFPGSPRELADAFSPILCTGDIPITRLLL